jgi:hypothetical protein
VITKAKQTYLAHHQYPYQMTNRKKSPHHLQEVGGPLMIMIKTSGLEALGIVTLTINARVVILGSGDDETAALETFFR